MVRQTFILRRGCVLLRRQVAVVVIISHILLFAARLIFQPFQLSLRQLFLLLALWRRFHLRDRIFKRQLLEVFPKLYAVHLQNPHRLLHTRRQYLILFQSDAQLHAISNLCFAFDFGLCLTL